MIAPEETADWDIGRNEVLLESLEKSLVTSTDAKKDVQSTGIISDLFDKEILTYLEEVFSTSETGNSSLSAHEFKGLISKYIPLGLVENIYRAIDVNDIGYVNYSDFTNYLISAEAGSTFSSKTYTTRLVLFNQQDDNINVIHRDFIDSLVFVRKPCPMLLSGGRDGQISIWDPTELTLVRNIQHRDSNSVYQEELYRSMDPLLKAHCRKQNSGHSAKKKSSKVQLLNSSCLLIVEIRLHCVRWQSRPCVHY